MEKKIAEIRKEFEAASFSEIPALIEAYWRMREAESEI